MYWPTCRKNPDNILKKMSEMWLPEVEDRAKWAMFRHLGEKNCFNLQATTIIKGFIQTYTCLP